MAENADGSIIINTDIDTEGFKVGSERIKKAVGSLKTKFNALGPALQKGVSGSASALSSFNSKAKALEKSVADIEAEMKTLGSAKVPTEEYTWLTKEIEKANKELIKLGERQVKMDATGVKYNSQAWRSLQYDISLAESKIKDHTGTLELLKEEGDAFKLGSSTPEFAALEQQLAAAKQQLSDMQLEAVKAKGGIAGLIATLRTAPPLTQQIKNGFSKLATLLSTLGSKIASTFKATGGAIKNAVIHPLKTLNSNLGKVTAGIGSLGSLGKKAFKGIGSAIKGGINLLKKFRKQSKGTNGAIGKLGKKITGLGSMLKRLALRKILMGVLTAVKDGFNNLAQYSTQTNADMSALKSSLTQLKNSFATAFAPILTIVVPILTKLSTALSEALTYVGKFAAALTGATTFTKATAVQEDYAASLKGTADAAEEAKNQVHGFDELNVRNSDTAAEKSDGNADPSEMFEEVPIESGITDYVNNLKEIFKNGDYAGLGEIIGNGINTAIQKAKDFISWDNIGSKVTGFVNGVAQGFNSLVDTVDWRNIGSTWANGFNSAINTLYLVLTEFDWAGLFAGFANILNGLVADFDWAKFGATLSTGMRTAINSLRSAITTFDWAALGKGVADGINNIDWVGILSDLAAGISDLLKGALDLLIGFAENLDWSKLGSDLWNGIIGIITNIDWGEIIAKAFQLLGAALAGAVSLIVGFAKSLWESLKSAFESTKNYFGQYIEEAGGNVIMGLLNGIWNGIKNIGIWIYEHIFVPFIEGFKNAFGIHSPSTVMSEMGGFLIQGLLNGITNLWHTITDFFSGALEGLKNLLSGAWEGIKQGAQAAWNGISGVVSSAWNGIKSGVSTACSAVGGFVSNAWNGIRAGASTAWNTVKSTVTNAWNGIKSGVSTAVNNVKSSVSTAWNGIKSTVSSVGNSIKSTATTAWNNLKSSVSTKVNNIKSSVSSAWDDMKSTVSTKMSSIKSTVQESWSSLKTKATTWGKDVCENMADGISKAKSAVESAVSSVASKIKSFLGFSEPEDGPLSNFHTYMPDMIDLMTKGIKQNQSKAIGAVSDMASAISGEIQNCDYAMGGVKVGSGATAALTGFSDKIVDGFATLMERLQHIADNVTFASPVVARSGLVPYGVSAKASRDDGGSGGVPADFVEMSNNVDERMADISYQLRQLIAIVKALNLNIDIDALTEMVTQQQRASLRNFGG